MLQNQQMWQLTRGLSEAASPLKLQRSRTSALSWKGPCVLVAPETPPACYRDSDPATQLSFSKVGCREHVHARARVWFLGSPSSSLFAEFVDSSHSHWGGGLRASHRAVLGLMSLDEYSPFVVNTAMLCLFVSFCGSWTLFQAINVVFKQPCEEADTLSLVQRRKPRQRKDKTQTVLLLHGMLAVSAAELQVRKPSTWLNL